MQLQAAVWRGVLLDDEDCVITDPADGQGYCAPKCRSNEIRCFKGRQCCPYGMDCCGEGCCDPSHSCCGDFATTEPQTCCPPGYGCSGGSFPRCECLGVQECGDRCCPGGQICFSAEDRDCRGPQMEDLDDLLDFLRQSLSGAGAASGGSAGAAARSPPPRAPATRSSPSARSRTWRRWRAIDSARAIRTRPTGAGEGPRPRLAQLAPGPGLDPSAAQALDRLLSVEARARALLSAAAVARGRSLGASARATWGRHAPGACLRGLRRPRGEGAARASRAEHGRGLRAAGRGHSRGDSHRASVARVPGFRAERRAAGGASLALEPAPARACRSEARGKDHPRHPARKRSRPARASHRRLETRRHSQPGQPAPPRRGTFAPAPAR